MKPGRRSGINPNSKKILVIFVLLFARKNAGIVPQIKAMADDDNA